MHLYVTKLFFENILNKRIKDKNINIGWNAVQEYCPLWEVVTLNHSVRIAPKKTTHLNDLDHFFRHSSDLVTPDGGVNNVISKVKKKSTQNNI